ncbi:ectonucleoside triphosphate diphosphohydrolase 4-like isoform X1 [Porites lutea]|uniref:ectonucleoside triphosphate diphosphohydrolase 4-like isoform X1 n=1 Tax=Porites lutea TaxID=51062 RepID=UPI003CC5AF07
MVGRISIRWTSFPSFLRPGVISTSTDGTCMSARRLFSHLFGTQPSPLRYLLVIGFIVILLLGFLLFMSDSSWYRSRTRRFTYHDFYKHGADSNYHYGIVIDCGSSGSRVFIYYWPPHNGNPDELLQIKQMVDSRGNPVRMKIKPGISSLVDEPSKASSYIEPLLDFAALKIPEHKHKETPLYVLATAGMRMLSTADQESILDDLRVDIPLKYNFHFMASHVEVITGKQEGIYSWIGVNFELGRFDHSHDAKGSPVLNSSVSEVSRKSTVGSLDMGGGSAQIAFEVAKSVWVPSELSAQVNLGCDSHQTIHNYHLYVATFLGFGSNAARDRYTELVLSQNESLSFDLSTEAYLDPCLPTECNEQVTHKGKQYKLIGTGEYYKCQKLILPLLNLTTPCPRQPCSFNAVYQPHIDYNQVEFYGFSEYWYSMHDVLRIGGQYKATAMKKAVEEFCKTRWSVLVNRHAKGLYPHADAHRLQFQCFKAAWVTTVLHQGFKFPQNYSNLRSAFYIGDKEVQWTLGAILYRTRFLPLREVQLHSQYKSSYHALWSYVSELQFRIIFLVCSVTVLAAILLYCRRLRRMSSTSSLWQYNSSPVLYNVDVIPSTDKIPVR